MESDNTYREINQLPEPLWDPKRVAEYLSIHILSVYRMIKSGRLKAVKVGNRIRIPVGEMNRIANEMQKSLK